MEGRVANLPLPLFGTGIGTGKRKELARASGDRFRFFSFLDNEPRVP